MNILEVIESYGVEAKNYGSIYKAICPFHDDHDPSLVIYLESDSWYCFGCEAGGDILSFISLIEGVDRATLRKRNVDLTMVTRKLEELEKTRVIDFKSETNLLVSRACYAFLQERPFKVNQVLEILKVFDAKLKTVEKLSYEEGTVLVDKFKEYLCKIN